MNTKPNQTGRISLRVGPIQQQQVRKLVRALKSSANAEYYEAMNERLKAFGLLKTTDDVINERKSK